MNYEEVENEERQRAAFARNYPFFRNVNLPNILPCARPYNKMIAWCAFIKRCPVSYTVHIVNPLPSFDAPHCRWMVEYRKYDKSPLPPMGGDELNGDIAKLSFHADNAYIEKKFVSKSRQSIFLVFVVQCACKKPGNPDESAASSLLELIVENSSMQITDPCGSK